MVPLSKSSCSNLQASEITLYILRATYWKETQNMPLFSPDLFSFLNILTDKVKVFWTHLYRQTGYCSLADPLAIVAHNIPPTSSLSPATNWPTLPAGKMDFKRPIFLPRHSCRLKMAVFGPSINTRGVCVVRRPTWTSDAQSECQPTRFTDSL